jgi:hypothetical protein
MTEKIRLKLIPVRGQQICQAGDLQLMGRRATTFSNCTFQFSGLASAFVGQLPDASNRRIDEALLNQMLTAPLDTVPELVVAAFKLLLSVFLRHRGEVRGHPVVYVGWASFATASEQLHKQRISDGVLRRKGHVVDSSSTHTIAL